MTPGPGTAGEGVPGEGTEKRVQDVPDEARPERRVDRGCRAVPVHGAVPATQHRERGARAGVERLDATRHLHEGPGRDRRCGRRGWPPCRRPSPRVRASQPGGESAGPEVGAVVEPEVVRIAGIGDPAVGGRDPAGGRVAHRRHRLERDRAGPLVGAVPPRSGEPGVRRRSHGHDPARPIPDRPLRVGEDQVVPGIHPWPHRGLQIVGGGRPEHRDEGVEGSVHLGRRRVAERQRVPVRGITQDDRPVVRHGDRDVDRPAPADVHGLVPDVCPPPLAPELVARGVGGVEALDEDVLVVRHRVRDAPGHVAVVAEVGEAGDAGKRKPDGVELGAGEMVLVVAVRGVEGAMGVARHEREPGGRPRSRQGPVVAPADPRGKRRERGIAALQRLQRVGLWLPDTRRQEERSASGPEACRGTGRRPDGGRAERTRRARQIFIRQGPIST